MSEEVPLLSACLRPPSTPGSGAAAVACPAALPLPRARLPPALPALPAPAAPPALARGRKRALTDEVLGLLQRCEACLLASPADAHERSGCVVPPDAHALLLAMERAQQLQAALATCLLACPIDRLTPHKAMEFIFQRRARVMKIKKNTFDVDAEEDDEELDGAATAGAPERREVEVLFQLGKDRLAVLCVAGRASASGSSAEGSVFLGVAARYTLEVRLVSHPKDELLLRCHSWNQAAGVVSVPSWEALRTRFQLDRRSAVDFARGLILLGVFPALNRRFARESSDSEDGAPGVVSTLSVCEMMAGALLPSGEGRLLVARPPRGAFKRRAVDESGEGRPTAVEATDEDDD